MKSVLETLPAHPAGHLLRRIAPQQLRAMMDRSSYLRGNILELADASANYMGPIGVTLVQSVGHKQARKKRSKRSESSEVTEFKFKIGIAAVKAKLEGIRTAGDVDITLSQRKVDATPLHLIIC